MKQSDVSVVICAYTEERWDDLVAAVASVQGQSLTPLEIVVVVDHNPRLLARVQADLPDVRALENSAQRGLSGAKNCGIAATRGSLIAFLDDDAEATPDWLEQLASFRDDPRVLGAGGAIKPRWQSRQPAWFPEEYYWVVGCSYRGLPEYAAPVRNIIGASCCIRREVFDTVGGFRAGIGREGTGTLPMGCEETELCIRAQQRWPDRFFLYNPRSIIHHRVPETRGRGRYFYARCYAEGRSKALVSRMVGTTDGLASERAYTARVLPRGVLAGCERALFHREPAGLLRSAAIVAGLLFTIAGYVVGLSSGQEQRSTSPSRLRGVLSSDRK